MPNTYEIKRVVAYEYGKDKTIKEIKSKGIGDKYLEILVPFSDPIAESPELQDASVRAMEHPHSTDDIFDLLKDLSGSLDGQIILSIYLNTAFAYGYKYFCRRAKDSGVYALNVKDMPFKERAELETVAHENGLNIINTIATSRPEALRDVLSSSKDAVYLSPAMSKKLSQEGLEALRISIHNDYGLDILTEN